MYKELNIGDINKVKRFTVLSDGKFSCWATFWIIAWLFVFFPALIIVVPYYMWRNTLVVIKAEHKDGTVAIYDNVSKKVIEALHKTTEF